MDNINAIKKALDEDGYYIDNDSHHVIISATKFPNLHTLTEDSLLDDATKQLYESLKPMYEQALTFSAEMISTVNEILPEIMSRTPESIKRDIKHEKNPMRLKQLNKELNMSYKFWRRKR